MTNSLPDPRSASPFPATLPVTMPIPVTAPNPELVSIPAHLAPLPTRASLRRASVASSDDHSANFAMFGLVSNDSPAVDVAAPPVAAKPNTRPARSAAAPPQAATLPQAPNFSRAAVLPQTAVLPPVPASPESAAAVDTAPAWDVASVPDVADPDLVAVLLQVVSAGGSDLHITANAGPTLRVDGRLRAIEGATVWSPEKVRSALFSVLTAEQKDVFVADLELDLAITVAEGARFRVNLYQQRGAIGGAFRLIPDQIRQLGELGVPEGVARFAALPRGLVLVTGPTGSGKSTTLAALLDLVNRTRADHIVTVEDPIEFLHENKMSLVTQREVGDDTHSFAAALKHVMRQDPDVILIGELRDLETIAVALTAAETGHLVFASLHTQDAAQSIDRMIDVFPPHQQAQVRSQLAATLQGVLCQALVVRASGQGRVIATEVLISTAAIANLIREGKTHQINSTMQAGRDLGMHTLDQSLAALVTVGTITFASARETARDVEGLRQLIQRDVAEPTTSSLAVGGLDFGDVFSAVEPTR